MSKKNIKKTTDQLIEELALSIGRGFAATASKDDVAALRQEVREGFASAEKRLEKMEYSTGGWGRRLETVEDRILQLARKAGLEFN